MINQINKTYLASDTSKSLKTETMRNPHETAPIPRKPLASRKPLVSQLVNVHGDTRFDLVFMMTWQ